MGRLEKIVVLTVLFLVAVILAVSLNREEVVAGPQDPLAEAPEAVQAEPEVLPAPAAEDQRLLSALTEDDQPEAAPAGGEAAPAGPSSSIAPGGDPAPTAPQQGEEAAKTTPEPSQPVEPAAPRPFLLTTEGLEESLVPELRMYTWREGDSFTAIADRYYGSRLEVGRLREANEGRDEATIRPGEKIWVPVEAPRATERLGRASSQAGTWNGGVYVVESGDMLSKIAQKTYGSASKWRRIYDANRDVLASPDALKVGMRLRIPAE